jgi:hypothetical protein
MPRKYKVRQPNRPSQSLTDKEILINATLKCLYAEQHSFWERRLTQLISKNLHTLGRKDHPRACAIHYAGRIWFRPWMDKENANDFLVSRVHSEHEKEAIEVTSELAELENEQYEVSRFMSGLLLFQAPVLEIKRALGIELVNEIEQREKVSFDSLVCSTGVLNNQTAALKIFVNNHDYVVEMMTERILANMILGQSVL